MIYHQPRNRNKSGWSVRIYGRSFRGDCEFLCTQVRIGWERKKIERSKHISSSEWTETHVHRKEKPFVLIYSSGVYEKKKKEKPPKAPRACNIYIRFVFFFFLTIFTLFTQGDRQIVRRRFPSAFIYFFPRTDRVCYEVLRLASQIFSNGLFYSPPASAVSATVYEYIYI